LSSRPQPHHGRRRTHRRLSRWLSRLARHSVIIPRRHFATLFEATEAEQAALFKALAHAKDIIGKYHQPDGYNIGINHGQAGGQSVPHLHIHLIPRYRGDKEDPRGGVRWVLPDKAKYWA
jgi:diadenosine tetraphosphate (Ap4A) HIT family hydrolase